MNLNETKRTANTCSACGTALPAFLPPDLCPKCLLKAGLPAPGVSLQHASPVGIPQTMPQPGEQFGRYRILRQIGQGGMGAVYVIRSIHVKRGPGSCARAGWPPPSTTRTASISSAPRKSPAYRSLPWSLCRVGPCKTG